MTADDGEESFGDALADGNPQGETGEDREEPPSGSSESGKAAARSIHKRIGSSIASVGNFVGGFTGQLLSPAPFSGKIWKGMAKRGLYNYYRTSGADRVGLEVGPNGKMQLTPVKWKSAEQCEQGERAGWHAKGSGESWKPTTLGQSGVRLGKTPLVPLDTESWKSTSILEARVAEAVDQGETRKLYRVDEAELSATIDMDGAAGRARADGGQMALKDRHFEPRSSPIFEDMIIDLGSDDYDGQAVSWLKTKELLAETTTQEEMANQETRGELMGRSRDDMKSMIVKIMLIAAAIALGGLIGPELINGLLNGGASGGGGLPLFLGAV